MNNSSMPLCGDCPDEIRNLRARIVKLEEQLKVSEKQRISAGWELSSERGEC